MHIFFLSLLHINYFKINIVKQDPNLHNICLILKHYLYINNIQYFMLNKNCNIILWIFEWSLYTVKWHGLVCFWTVWWSGPSSNESFGILDNWLIYCPFGGFIVPHHCELVVYNPLEFTHVTATWRWPFHDVAGSATKKHDQ